MTQVTLTEDQIRSVLSTLRVKPGLRWVGFVDLDQAAQWQVALEYSHDSKAFTVSLRHDRKTRTVTLAKEFVETRGKSPWMTANTWRLSESGLEHMTRAIFSAIQKTTSVKE
jgi:hypothetical protein